MVFFFEIIGAIFLLVMIYLTYVEYKRNRLTLRSFVFWLIIWLGGILLVLLHQNIETLLPALSIVRVLDLYMILAFMFFFAMIFYLFRIIKNAEKRVEEVVRKVALKQVK